METRRGLLRVALGVLFLKAYVLLMLYALFLKTDLKRDYGAFLFLEEDQSRKERLAEIQESFVERLAPYDGQFYLDIARRGYRRFAPGRTGLQVAPRPEGNYAFFPLLPLVLRVFGAQESRAGRGAVLLLNTLFATLGCTALWLLARSLGVSPWLTLGFLLSYPGVVFHSVLYPESLFLLLSAAAGLLASRGRLAAAALLGTLGGLCRPQGVLLGALSVPLAGARRGSRESLWLRGLVLLAPVAGLATFAALLGLTLGAPLAFVEIQRDWGREFSPAAPLRELFDLSSRVVPPLDRLGVLLGVGLLPFLWRTLPRPLALYGTLSVALPLLSGSALSMGRFLSVSFPHFLCLSRIFGRWRVASGVLIAAFAALQALLARGLVAWHFVG